MNCLRIVGWDRYEVSDKGRPWKPGDTKRVGPLSYVRYEVNVMRRRVNDGWSRMLKVATQRRAAWVNGVFGKLLEMVGELPGNVRDGWILVKNGPHAENGWRPATAEDIAGATGLSLGHVEVSLIVLAHPHVRWLSDEPYEPIPGEPGTTRDDAG